MKRNRQLRQSLGLGLSRSYRKRMGGVMTVNRVRWHQGAERSAARCLTASLLLLSVVAWADDTPKLVSFDAPGAGPVGTFPYSINSKGAIVGWYYDSGNASHGFLRAPDGTMTEIDAPGAGNTYAGNINAEGVITGDYTDANFVSHGYVRAPDGTLTTFDGAGAGTAAGQGTFLCVVDCINSEGTIAAGTVDANGINHGLVRSRHGQITIFDVPGAGNAAGQGTVAGGINDNGTVQGTWLDINGVAHGFVRSRDGTIATFDVLGATNTFPANINNAGIVVGAYTDAGSSYHAFIRMPSGTITTFEVANAAASAFTGTQAFCNNAADAITGSYTDTGGATHAFKRSPRGTITGFDGPGSSFTQGLAINAAGTIIGFYVDANSISHGFARFGSDQ
jgi:hypothetical protein